MSSLEHSILDLNAMVEKCQREIDKNSQKRDRLKQENTDLQGQLIKLQQIFKDLMIDDPVKFKSDYDILVNTNVSLNKDLQAKT